MNDQQELFTILRSIRDLLMLFLMLFSALAVFLVAEGYAQSSPPECWTIPGYANAHEIECFGVPSPEPTVVTEGYYGQGNQKPVIRERTCAQKLRAAKRTIKRLRRRR